MYVAISLPTISLFPQVLKISCILHLAFTSGRRAQNASSEGNEPKAKLFMIKAIKSIINAMRNKCMQQDSMP